MTQSRGAKSVEPCTGLKDSSADGQGRKISAGANVLPWPTPCMTTSEERKTLRLAYLASLMVQTQATR
jgi:hypothetical protein